jgi:twitching motility two-component system response regulator PilG
VGSSAYLTKPFSKDSLLAAVRDHAQGAANAA